MISDFRWPEPENQVDERLISNVRVHGCHVLKIFADDEPQFAYSVGLFLNYSHPEIIIVGLNDDLAHQIINDICERCAQGQTFLGGQRTDQLLKGYDACFIEVDLAKYPDYLGYALWFYGSLTEPFPAVQMVWPDRAGKFPWEQGYDVSFKALQPILAQLV